MSTLQSEQRCAECDHGREWFRNGECMFMVITTRGCEQYCGHDCLAKPDAAPTGDSAEGEAHCWHCGVAVVGVPRPRCEGCPAECDVENCDAFGCRAPSPSVSPIATDNSAEGELSAPSWLLANEIAKAVWEKRVYLRRVHKTPVVAIGEAARIIEPFLIASSTVTAEQTARELPHWSEPPYECTAFDRLLEPLARAIASVASGTNPLITVPDEYSERICCELWEAERRLFAIQSSVATVSPGTEPWYDANDHPWEIRRNVDCVECPHCAFTFAAVHTSGDSNGYECPACEGCPDDVLVVPPDAPDEGPTGCLDDNDPLAKALRQVTPERLNEILAEELPNRSGVLPGTEAQARDKDTTEAEAIASYYPNVKGSEKIALVEDIKEALTTARRETALHSRFAAGVQACIEQMKALRNDWNTRYEQAGNLSMENHWFDKVSVADQVITAISAISEAPAGEDS